MALLEYLNRTVPEVMPKSVQSFFYNDQLMKELRAKGMVKKSGGSHVRIVRVKSGHSDITEINGSNLSVALTKKETFSSMTGDWGRHIKPIIIAHPDISRMESAEQKKAHVMDTVNAVVQSFKNDYCRRVYLGDTSSAGKLAAVGTLNGGRSAANNANGTSSGFVNGALEFDTPTTQDTNGNTYLNEARTEDSTNDEDNWYNQFAANTGIGTDALKAAELVKLRADTYCEDEEGISLGILGLTEHQALGDEVRSYPGGGSSAIVYTPDDIENGRAHKVVLIAGGIKYFSNRWMTAAALGNFAGSGGNIDDAIYFLNPNTIELWINKGYDFKVTKFTDHLETSNQDADIAYVILESQFAVRELLANGCTRS